jgi:hypothetical protein
MGGDGGSGGGNPVDCIACIAQRCPAFLECVQAPVCARQLSCAVNSCFDGPVPDLTCSVDCFDGNAQQAQRALLSVLCAVVTCSDVC